MAYKSWLYLQPSGRVWNGLNPQCRDWEAPNHTEKTLMNLIKHFKQMSFTCDWRSLQHWLLRDYVVKSFVARVDRILLFGAHAQAHTNLFVIDSTLGDLRWFHIVSGWLAWILCQSTHSHWTVLSALPLARYYSFQALFHFRIKWLPVCHMVQNNPTTILMTLDWNWRNRNCTLGYCMPNGWGICATGWRPAYFEAAFLMDWELHMLRFTNRCKLLGQCWTQRFAWNLPNSRVKTTRISSIAGSFFFLGRTLDVTIPQIPFPNQITDGSIILVLILPLTWADHCFTCYGCQCDL